MSEWKTIDSAPKDKSILVTGGTFWSDEAGCGWGNSKYDLKHVTIAYWKGDAWCLGSGDAYNEEYWAEPTHWMPLPEPPQ